MLNDPFRDVTVSIVIVSYNSRDELSTCLTSIVDKSAPFRSTVIVVDNASTDRTVEMLRADWPMVRVIETGENVGFARGSNIGIRASDGEFVLLLNPDTIARPGALATLIRVLDCDPRVAAAGPRLVDADGCPELSFGWEMGPLGELFQKTVRALYGWRVVGVVKWVEWWTKQPGDRRWLSGACLAVRRSDLDAVGLLDERFFMYAEDVDLCVALRKRGRGVVFAPAAEVVHLRGRSAAPNPRTEQMRRQSQLAYYEKHHPFWVPALKLFLRVTGRNPSAE